MQWEYSATFKFTDFIVGYVSPVKEDKEESYRVGIKIEEIRFVTGNFEEAKKIAEQMLRGILYEGKKALDELDKSGSWSANAPRGSKAVTER